MRTAAGCRSSEGDNYPDALAGPGAGGQAPADKTVTGHSDDHALISAGVHRHSIAGTSVGATARCPRQADDELGAGRGGADPGDAKVSRRRGT